MSLQSQLHSFVLRVAEKFGALEARTGPLERLHTEHKADLVGAINEVADQIGPSPGPTGHPGVEFVQVSPAQVWTVNHNLGWRPTVTVIDTGGAEVQADIHHTHLNQVLIHFALPMAGRARLT